MIRALFGRSAFGRKQRKGFRRRLEDSGHTQANQAITELVWFTVEPFGLCEAPWNSFPKE